MTQRLNQLINNQGVGRTAPATLSLLNSVIFFINCYHYDLYLVLAILLFYIIIFTYIMNLNIAN